MNKQPIGVFDSGYGGLTVLKELTALLPQYDYLYMGDNARAPYGGRSFQTVYEYTLQAVKWFFEQGCPLVILACNTASAKALRTIQQIDLPQLAPQKRVLGVIRPSAEVIGNFTISKQVGILGTQGTIQSGSYILEIQKFFPGVQVFQQACPLWVPLIENNEYLSDGADYFVQKNIQSLLSKAQNIDTILLACTHYPLLLQKILKYMPDGVNIVSHGPIVAQSLKDYLLRHPEIEATCSKNSELAFFTTDTAEDFDNHSIAFFGRQVQSKHLLLG